MSNKTQSILEYFQVPSLTSELGSEKYVTNIIENMLERFIGEPYTNATFERAIRELLNEMRERQIMVERYDCENRIVNGVVISIRIYLNHWAEPKDFLYAFMDCSAHTIINVERVYVLPYKR